MKSDMVIAGVRAVLLVGLGGALALGSGCETSEPRAESTACCECSETSAVAKINEQAVAAPAYATEWKAPEHRGASLDGFSFENQNGRKISFRDLEGAPVALSFIYTRCQNERKCPLVTRTMGELSQALTQDGGNRANLLLVTYDPEFDTPAELTKFGQQHGFDGGTNAMLLRPAAAAKERLFERLNVGVNYNERGVNLHGIQLILLDKQARHVRTYHTRLWNNADVVKDLRRLMAEQD